ncbi:unnamed protein product, partial [Brenthis ino]
MWPRKVEDTGARDELWFYVQCRDKSLERGVKAGIDASPGGGEARRRPTHVLQPIGLGYLCLREYFFYYIFSPAAVNK